MLEPVSAAAGLVLFGATLTYRINYMIGRCSEASDRIRRLHTTLQNTTNILEMVDELRTDATGAFSEDFMGHRLDHVFDGLQELFDKLNRLLDKYIPTSRPRKVKWMMKGLGDAMVLQEEIDRYYTALNVGFNMVTVAVGLENR